ncbi:putative AgrB-like protein [Clostridium pasteurianum DSM 525 = ATCC 6013]|uniref:Putative AgrB-like protein n=1 Tax=Clostridium pasteurianum DSM 525 = ATCC 6013 TaxID=1262449 RepID=A0A0H3J8J9_CLOPA|nr:accessory gene regulator B family protein [Clostridium pasteurianum]AJA47395.1 putative AgrB-like protein [Clostridium pasteurianum DSM 525 = ATCC 6013]AJA51383.1 putative AgrB-like protein [Clostridium pasteurianum DSM 525 = ATCC 6013]AOZ74723.1 accessory regulator AgrB [Clostridium pasteurianum DSM 525 = ATCC 6013]AOZ78519.1 accessory regulator AgrB [Clostridium pasteurianum]ELP58731.1 regulator [Clostridium pasteurianum DSM 525 = ATCC 6013]
MNFIEMLSESIVLKLNRNLNKEGLELQKMKLGIEILLINISKLIIIMSASIYFNLIKQTAFMIIIFAVMRRNAFGLHAKNSVVCTIMSLTMFVFGAYLSSFIKLNNYIVFIAFVIMSFLFFKYAPSDTEKHPLLGKKLRNKLKKNSVLNCILLMIIVLVMSSKEIKTLSVFTVAFEVISILPVTYRILKRSWKNYEKYES